MCFLGEGEWQLQFWCRTVGGIFSGGEAEQWECGGGGNKFLVSGYECWLEEWLGLTGRVDCMRIWAGSWCLEETREAGVLKFWGIVCGLLCGRKWGNCKPLWAFWVGWNRNKQAHNYTMRTNLVSFFLWHVPCYILQCLSNYFNLYLCKNTKCGENKVYYIIYMVSQILQYCSASWERII